MATASEFTEKELLDRNIYGVLNIYTKKRYWLRIMISNYFPLYAFAVLKSLPTSFCKAPHLSVVTLFFAKIRKLDYIISFSLKNKMSV